MLDEEKIIEIFIGYNIRSMMNATVDSGKPYRAPFLCASFKYSNY